MAPIVIARLNTEQSYFQYKDSVQEMVRGVIEAYWNLVQARVAASARKIQVEQSKEAFERETGSAQNRPRRRRHGGTGAGDLQPVPGQPDRGRGERPDAGRGLAEPPRPAAERRPANRAGLRADEPAAAASLGRAGKLAEQRRPDIVELKLVTEADQPG